MIGRVYKIIVNSSNEIYIGSTFQECRARWQDHKSDYFKFKFKNMKKTRISSFDLFDKYDIENCKIILIKEYKVCDRLHLEAYEQLWINKLKPINKKNPFSPRKIYRKYQYKKTLEQNPNYLKDEYKKTLEQNPNHCKDMYRKTLEKNPNHCKDKYRKRLEKNPNHCKDMYKKALEQNPNLYKDMYKKALEKNPNFYKEAYQKKREKLSEKVLCECGCEMNRSSIVAHTKTKKHQTLMEKKSQF